MLFQVSEAKSQTLESCSRLLDQIGDFEGQRDPKCAATANRLEDFIYGTPLEESARVKKADLQKALILSIWIECDSLDQIFGGKEISILTLKSVLQKVVDFKETDLGFETVINGQTESISKRDLKHYGSVAYAYRAILSLQQEMLFNSRSNLPPLTSISTKELKSFIDKVTLVALKLADKKSRTLGADKVDAAIFESAWKTVVPSSVADSPFSSAIFFFNTKLAARLRSKSS